MSAHAPTEVRVYALTADQLEQLVERAARKAVGEALMDRLGSASTDDRLAPLHEIIASSPAAARMRLTRDKKLAALGVRDGRRLLFRPSIVRAYLSERPRPATSTAALDALERGRAGRRIAGGRRG